MIQIYDLTTAGYELSVTVNDDGSVVGTTGLADRIEATLSRFEAAGYVRADYIDDIQDVLERRYNSGYRVAVRVD